MCGILSEPIDARLASETKRKRRDWPKVEAKKGLVIKHRVSGDLGAIVRFQGTKVTIRDKSGREIQLPVAEGDFLVKAVKGRVTLIRPKANPESKAKASQTASGSIANPNPKARQAIASRILVEGLHDAELVEKVWGDDLREEGVVVLPLHGADDLAAVVAEFEPGPERRLGILLDHLVDHSKESRIASQIDDPNVLICGHPYVDIWEAILPEKVGLSYWPTIPMGTDWKTGVKTHLGFQGETGELWRHLLGKVSSFQDLEAPLIGAVEQLIDFVAPPPVD